MAELNEKEQALEVVKKAARDEAEKSFAEKAKEFAQMGVKSEEAKQLMKEVAEEAMKNIEVKDGDKNIALNTLLKEMQDQHDKLSAKVNGQIQQTQSTKSFSELIYEGLQSKSQDLAALKASKNAQGLDFNVKAAGTVTMGNYTGGTYGLTNWDPEYARIQRRQPFMRDLVRTVTTDNMYIAWAEQANPDGAVDTVSEGAVKPLIDFDIVERTAKVEKIAGRIKASKESLADIKILRGEIDYELVDQIQLKLDQQILSGNGTSPNLKGILAYAPTFNAATAGFTTNVARANRYDVVVAAISQIGVSNFQATDVVVNTIDFYSLMLTKDANGQYLQNTLQPDGSAVIAGLRLVRNNGVAAGTFLVGDFKRDTLAIREEINIQVGYENDDFSRNLVTIIAEMRAVNYIKANYVNAFVQGTFATAITAINSAT